MLKIFNHTIRAMLFLILIPVFSSCAGSGDSTDTGKQTTIYTAGYHYTSITQDSTKVPCYWKNQTRTDLPQLNNLAGGEATSIAVSGSDVYVVGFTRQTTKSVPCYWKNDNRTDLSTIDANQSGKAQGIFINGSKIYIAGQTINAAGKGIPCYWENGNRTDLSTLAANYGGIAWSIFVSGSVIYVSGNTQNDISDFWTRKNVPCYWANGTRTDLSGIGGPPQNATGHSYAYSIIVKDSDIYVSGTTMDKTDLPYPCYWLNGDRTDLKFIDPSRGAYGWNMALSGSNMYVAGWVASDIAYLPVAYPAYWKNDTMNTLLDPEGSIVGQVYDVKVFGVHVYLSGYTRNWDDNTSQNIPCYWVSDSKVDLPVPDGSGGDAKSIYAIE